MASDMFLKMTTVEGETKDEKHPKEVEIESWQWGMSQASYSGRIGGGGQEAATVSDIVVTFYVDTASARLIQMCQTGAHFDEAVITQRKAGGKQEEFIKFTMKKGIISSYNMSSAGPTVMISASLNFEEYHYQYWPQNDDGTVGTVKEFEYNIAKRKE